MSNCLCTPGSEENHWFEERDPKCVKVEIQQWKDMMDDFPRVLDMIRRMREDRGNSKG